MVFSLPPSSPSTKARMLVRVLPIRSAFTTRARGTTKTGSSLPAPNGLSRSTSAASDGVTPGTASAPSRLSTTLAGSAEA